MEKPLSRLAALVGKSHLMVPWDALGLVGQVVIGVDSHSRTVPRERENNHIILSPIHV